MKRFIALLLSILFVLSFAACGESSSNGGENTGNNGGTVVTPGGDDDYVPGNGDGPNSQGEYNHNEKSNKTVINVTSMNGGVGNAWLDATAERFAEEYNDYSFGGGHTGVYVNITKQMGTSGVTANFGSNNVDVCFSERAKLPGNLASQGILADLTDVVTDTFRVDDEELTSGHARVGGSLEDNIFDNIISSCMGSDGKYYGIPHYEFYANLSYNHEVLEKYGAFFAADDETDIDTFDSGLLGETIKLVGSTSAKKSKGPDDEYGTTDDGLPCSFEEFVAFMEYLDYQGIAPVCLAGSCRNYSAYAMCGFWASFAGQQQMANYYDCSGMVEVVTGYTTESILPGIEYIKKPTTEWIELTAAAGYLGNNMVAKYYAYAMMEIIQREEYYTEKETGNANISHTDAMEALISGGNNKTFTGCAMLIDGSYWYNEAKDNGRLESYATQTGDKHEVDVRLMALPTTFSTAERSDPNSEYYNRTTSKASCLLDIGQGWCNVNSKVEDNQEKYDAVKAFVAFCYSEPELRSFTAISGQSRAINYSLTKNDLAGMSTYYQYVWNLRDNENGSNIVYAAAKTIENGGSAERQSLFLKSRSTLILELSSPLISTAADSTPSVYKAYSDETQNADGTYKYGAKANFEYTKITSTAWLNVYTVRV